MPVYLGLDFGKKRIGFAVSDESGSIATPLKTIEFKSRQYLLDEIKELIRDYSIQVMVVGLPVDLKGGEAISADWVKKHVDWLKGQLTAEWVLWDERLSTREVEKMLIGHDVSRLKRKEVIDQLAAQRILQNYLDYRRFQKERE